MRNILEFGVVAASDSAQTSRFQSAIDAVHACGGGTLVVPAGRYVTGTLRLRSHVTLHLDNGALIRGSPDMADYPEVVGGFTDAVGQKRNRCLLYAEGEQGVALTGEGTVDGNGPAFGREQQGRPFLLRFIDCTDVRVRGVTLRDSPGWVSHYLGCENVLIEGITIHSHTNANNDGIDIDSCSRVRVIGCDIDTGDDAVCIKATRARPCENIVVTSCVLRSIWGALKLGTESAGDFRNICISNCVIRDTHGGGLKIISMDGSRIENIRVSDLVMDRVSGPIFIRLGSRLRRYHEDQPTRRTGVLRNVTIRGVTGDVREEGYPLYGKLPRRSGILITGVPGHPIEALRLEDVRLRFPGGGTPEEAAVTNVPEQETEYPEFPAFHPLPSWGVFARHVRDLVLRDVVLELASGDARAPMVAQDVSGLRICGSLADGRDLSARTLDPT